MNKINIGDSNIIIDNEGPYFFEMKSKIKSTINVEKNISSKIIVYSNNNDYDLIINVKDNSKLLINSLNKNIDSHITINLYENATIEYNHSIVSDMDSSCDFIINHLYPRTKSLINNNGINLNNQKLFFKIDGIISRESCNAESAQYSKIINFKNGNSKIVPNFIIDNHDIVANHSAYIGNFNDEEIFYIKSRGLNEEDMYRLLYRSLLLGSMYLDEEKELFNKLLKEWGLL